MMPFDWVQPDSLREAVSMLDPEDQSIRPLAGGTALMLMMKAGVFYPSRLISLANIERHYSEIAREASGALRIGAMASLSALEQSGDAKAEWPVIAATMKTLSNVRVRNVARVGGALAHGDPHMDLPPLMAALGAAAHVVGPDGTREIAVEDLYVGYYETVLAKNELIGTISVPVLQGRKSAYVKVTSRSADDWPALGVAVCFGVEGNILQEPRFIVSAATEKVTRLKAAEAILSSAEITDSALKRAGEAAADETPMLADAHGSVAYKKELLRIHLGRAIRQAMSGQAGGHA